MDKFDINDHEYIVVEFINESRKVSVCYVQWVLSKKPVDYLIKNKEIVEISWPKDQEILPAKKLIKELNKKKMSNGVLGL